jgi:peptidyl-prolyl cis-trans isomerase C
VSALFDATGQTSAPTVQQERAAREGMDQVSARLAGGEDFSAIADELSASPGAAVTGGNLGCFAEQGSTLPTQLVDAAFQQPVGEVGAVVQTDVGFHILLVRSRGVFPFEEAEEAIRQQLEQQTGSAVQAEATRFLNESTIEVDPRFGTFDTETAAVVPPEGPTAPPSTGLPDPLANLPGRAGADEPTEPGTP